MHRFQIISLVLFSLLTACIVDASPPVQELSQGQTETATPSSIPTGEGTPIVTNVADSTVSSTPSPLPSSSSTPFQAATAEVPATTAPPATATRSPKEVVALELAESLPPERDDVRLAIAFHGLSESLIAEAPLVGGPLPVGAMQSFTVPNVVDNTVSDIDAELLAVSEHAYFWFDKGPGSLVPNETELKTAAQTFDEIYEGVVYHFGSERNPGIDGDPRLHIVHASPIALCGVTEDTVDQCSLAGLVNSTDLLPAEVDPRSNEREMFMMNGRHFGTNYYLGVLAHEFRHMIEDNYGKADTDWEIEGSATLAAQLLGMQSGGVERGNMFLEYPDQQLNSWVEEGTAPYYGQGYLLNRYLYDRLGEDLYREFATNPLPGFKAVDAVAEAYDLDFDGESVWLDWLVALAIHDDPQAPEKYQFESTGLNTAVQTAVVDLPAIFREEVSQYAADYYEIPADTNSIIFAGDNEIPLLDAKRDSGDWIWYAQRANYSNPRLTRAFDLRNTEKATLIYDVYADIESGYDFAYASVSLDDGRTWLPLTGEQMQGLNQEDNPAGSALVERFYTGRTRQWVEERIDLTNYTGQEILLRFEYVTDPILTYSGLALDDIAIPEIDYFDDLESDSPGWLAEGFTRATISLPQTWHLQLITYGEEGLEVRRLPVDVDEELSLALDGDDIKQQSVLIVAATAPVTLERANYELRIDR